MPPTSIRLSLHAAYAWTRPIERTIMVHIRSRQEESCT